MILAACYDPITVLDFQREPPARDSLLASAVMGSPEVMMGYEKTVVAVAKSQEGIRKMIYAHRGTGVSFISQPPREGLEAMMTINQTPYLVRIMATCRVFPSYAPKDAKEQEERRVWRVLYWHLKAIFEAADSGVIDIRDVILPYVVTPDGHTLSERIIPRLETFLRNPERLLLEDSHYENSHQ